MLSGLGWTFSTYLLNGLGSVRGYLTLLSSTRTRHSTQLYLKLAWPCILPRMSQPFPTLYMNGMIVTTMRSIYLRKIPLRIHVKIEDMIEELCEQIMHKECSPYLKLIEHVSPNPFNIVLVSLTCPPTSRFLSIVFLDPLTTMWWMMFMRIQAM